MIVPDDMNDRELAKKFNAEAVTSVRDTLILLGYTDEELRRYDIDRAEMQEILAREPWRKKPWRQTGTLNGYPVGFQYPPDWSGTRFEK